jgi:uncharacterized membrane protein YeaQ/YmgE (transglycosylase-associated protein family)
MNGFMLEHIMQMGPMLVLAGLSAGWVAQTLSRADTYGFIHDMALGLIGSVVVGVTTWFAISSEAGMLAMFLIGCGGAALAIGAQRTFWRSGAVLIGQPRSATLESARWRWSGRP